MASQERHPDSNLETTSTDVVARKEKQMLIDTITHSTDLTPREKEIFIGEILNVPDPLFPEVYDFIVNNYDEVLEWVRLKGSIDGLLRQLDNVDVHMYTLQKNITLSMGKKEEGTRTLDQRSAESQLSSYFE